MNTTQDIFKEVIKNLSNKKIDPSPIAYTEEFCKIARKVNFDVKGCDYLNEISKLIKIANRLMSNAIGENIQSSSDIISIKVELESLQITNSINKDVLTLKTKLIDTVDTIENQMKSVHKNLVSSKNEVISLEKKIQLLERELTSTKEESSKDYLTQLLNRRSLEKELELLDQLYTNSANNYAIVFFDIDHFKKVNDTYGHDAGDMVLKTFAAILKKLTKHTDIIARYGGEEFVAVISYNNINDIVNYIKRIKNVVHQNKFTYKEYKIKLTFSGGIESRLNNNSYSQTLINADKLLYKAKENGRDKIIFWNDDEL